jgi:biotin operon repressor
MIAMTAHGSEGFAIAGRLFEHGVKDCISKPFPRSGRTLAVVIESVLHSAYAPQEPEKTPKAATEPFEGGELVFYRDRAELCGVTIANASRSSQVWTILTTLNETLANGRYRAFSGNELAAKISRAAGQGSIAGSIRDFRRSVAETLGRELGLKLEPQDVIETSHGYRFKTWITTKDMRVTRSGDADTGGTNGSADRVDAGSDDRVTDRRDQIVVLIQSGERLRVPGFAQKLKCSDKTVSRALDALRAEGRVEFVGASRTGYYRLIE